MTTQIDTRLKSHALKVTPIRSSVLEIFLENGKQAITKKFVEESLEEIDRVTLYRTLKAFEEKHLIHKVVDGTDRIKYALCEEKCTVHNHRHDHAHFHCQKCGKTECLDESLNLNVTLPEGYRPLNSHFTIEGLCGDC